ncbi:NAD(P)H-dependent oxidoreductase [Hydrogenophaga sp. OTU3427]|uniref:NAD(P)H-dependent oxidoreductase n=1 Tax=Hydrogenophaga sp. OTU3427 TaxID=3043856 RepID=UPI00313ABA56
MNTLIVYAHPEPRSFNAALREVAVDTLHGMGHAVVVSDLYAMGFAPVVGRADFLTQHNPERFNVSLEQRHAVAHGGLAPDIARELARLQAADLVILQFPLWWFGLPAILKGWIDRVFVSGVSYGRSTVFENGKFRGKRAMVCVTTGGPAQSFGPDALNGDILDLLMPLHRGVLGFTGMTVLPPFTCFHVPYEGDAARRQMLQAYRSRLGELDRLTPLPMPRTDQYPGLLVHGQRPCAQ